MSKTRRPRRNPDQIKHISKQERLRYGQIMSDAEQAQIEALWKEDPTPVIDYRPGSAMFDDLSVLYQGTWHHAPECDTDFRSYVMRS